MAEGQLIICMLILFILVSCGLYLYHSARYNEYPVKEGQRLVTIINTTSLPYLLSVSGGSLEIKPKDSVSLLLSLHESLSALTRYPDGSEVEHVHRFSNDKVNHLYITPDGFRSNLSCSTHVQFVNESSQPILFIQKGLKGNKKWIKELVPADTTSNGHTVGFRSVWEIANEKSPNKPLDELRVGSKIISKLVFDGFRLKTF